jgi:CBS domain containing-hemolysin-like protein
MTIKLIGLAILLCFSAFFSGSETALFSLNRLKVKQMAASRSSSKGLVAKMLSNPHRLLATILFGNMLVNVASSSLGENITSHVFSGGTALFVAVLAMTLLILLFGEIMPKIIAVEWPAQIAPFVAVPLNIFSMIISPARRSLQWITDLFLGPMGHKPTPAQGATGEELKTALDIGYSEGEVHRLERDLIEKVISFGDKRVEQVMTPRMRMVSIGVNTPLDRALRFLKRKGYSRVPVYEGNEETIVGVLHIKDFLRHQKRESLRDYLRPVYFIPETKKIDDLFREFQTKRQHFAVVIDEYGVVSGMITMDDLLEEIVGKIAGKKREAWAAYRKVSRDRIVVEAAMELEDFNQQMRTSLRDDQAQSIGGYVVNQLGRIPRVKEKVRIGDLEFEILEAGARRIIRMEVTKGRLGSGGRF